MKNMFKFFLFLFILTIFIPQRAFAVEDPRSVQNNKIGIHILFPDEINNAAQLVNSNGGDWGYVTIPIQAGDRDLQKWQTFMDLAKKYHVIPIIRLATEGDYFNTKVWRKPTFEDVLDFANFLNSLDWPTQNRYVSVFNEVNRADEWGGEVNPAEYGRILSYAVVAFKSLNQDFFILSAGLDNAAPTLGTTYKNEYEFLTEMQREEPDIFNQIDGISSHSYPNPGFSEPPSVVSPHSITSFRFEKNLIYSLAHKDLPVFITETGWKKELVTDENIASYYQEVFSSTWNDNEIIAVTPFLLRAGFPFEQFSFVNQDGSFSVAYKTIEEMQKIKGAPKLAVDSHKKSTILGSTTHSIKNFSHAKEPESNKIEIPKGIKIWLRWLLKI